MQCGMTQTNGSPEFPGRFIYWLILDERIDMYLNCETGPCKYKRSIFSK